MFIYVVAASIKPRSKTRSIPGDRLGALRGSNGLADRVIETDNTVLVDANLVEPEDSRHGGCKGGVENRAPAGRIRVRRMRVKLVLQEASLLSELHDPFADHSPSAACNP